ncbi:MAG: hypothetical protein WCS42_21095 [Verrucomicrobiota bacterium]
MKTILLLTCALALLATAGCHDNDGRHNRYGNQGYHNHSEVIIVPAPHPHHDND